MIPFLLYRLGSDTNTLVGVEMIDNINLQIIISIPFFLSIIYLKLIEEKRLLKDFGTEFIEYKDKVPMMVPFLKLNYERSKRNHL